MFRLFNPIEAMALSIRMALAAAEAQRMLTVRMIAVAGVLTGMTLPDARPRPAAPEAGAAERGAPRSGGGRRKSGGGTA